MMNRVLLIGRLGRDPETKYTSGGAAVCTFSLATDESFKDRNGERQKRTEWHRVVVWEKPAEIAQQYLKKGSLVYVEGRLETRAWEKRDGTKQVTTQVVATTLRMLDGKHEPAAEAESHAVEAAEQTSKHGSKRPPSQGTEESPVWMR